MTKTTIRNLILLIIISISIIVVLKMLPETKKVCKDFISRNEVDKYFIKNNAIWLDKDSDGIPCETIK